MVKKTPIITNYNAFIKNPGQEVLEQNAVRKIMGFILDKAGFDVIKKAHTNQYYVHGTQ